MWVKGFGKKTNLLIAKLYYKYRYMHIMIEVLRYGMLREVFTGSVDLCVETVQLGEYSDPFDLKEATAERETVEAEPGVILPLSEDDYSEPYEIRDRRRGKTRN